MIRFKPLVKEEYYALKKRELGTEFPKATKFFSQNQQIHAFSEQESDSCLEESTRCVMTDRCLKMENAGHSEGYTLTHEIIYFVQLMHCLKDEGMREEIKPILRQKISNLAEQIQKIEKEHPNMFTDLHVERYFIMMLAGYGKDAVDQKIIEKILNHQDSPLGCWGDNTGGGSQALMDMPSGDSCSFHFSGLAASVLAFALDY